MMGNGHVGAVFGYWLLTIIPACFVAKKAGFSPWWCLLTLTPVTALIGLWLLAFVAWPAKGPSIDG